MHDVFAEEGLRVQGMMANIRSAVEQGKPHFLWVKTDQWLTEADFGFMDIDQLHHMAARRIDYYIAGGMHFGCREVMVPPDSPIKSEALPKLNDYVAEGLKPANSTPWA